MTQKTTIHHMTRLLLIAAVVVAAFIAIGSFQSEAQGGNTYYVDSASGSDNNSGLSPEQAWKRLDKVGQATLRPGDIVLFRRGQVFSENYSVSIGESGTASAPIILGAFGKGAAPILENTNGGMWNQVLRIDGSHIIIRDLALRKATEAGVYIYGDNVTVENTEIYDTGVGVFSRGRNTIVRRNHIHNLKMVVNDGYWDNDFGAIGVFLTSVNPIVAHNSFINLLAPSIDYGYDGSTVEFYGAVNNAQIYGNYTNGCNDYLEIGSAENVTLTNLSIHHNLIVNCHKPGVIHVRGGGTQYGVNVDNVRIENNTFIGLKDGMWMSTDPPAGEVFIRNNIFAMNDLSRWNSMRRVERSNNLYFSLESDVRAPGFPLVNNEQASNPNFANRSANNFQLRRNSAARDAGASLGYTRDFFGNPIIGTPDIGAFESRAPLFSGENLLVNGGLNSIDGWAATGEVGIRCNEPGNRVSLRSTCTAQFSGNNRGVLRQFVPTGGINPGDTLTATVFGNSRIMNPGQARLVLVVNYTDGTRTRDYADLGRFMENHYAPYSATVQVTKPVARIMVKLIHKGGNGAMLTDQVSLVKNAGDANLRGGYEVTGTSEVSPVLALPEAAPLTLPEASSN